MLRPYSRAMIYSLRLRRQVNFLSSPNILEELGLVVMRDRRFASNCLWKEGCQG